MNEAGRPFCARADEVSGNALALVRHDRYPVTPRHQRVIPRRHVADVFDATAEERAAPWGLLQQAY